MFCKNRALHRSNYSSENVLDLLTKDVWTAIRSSEVFGIDYEVFNDVSVGPFDIKALDTYSSFRKYVNSMNKQKD